MTNKAMERAVADELDLSEEQRGLRRGGARSTRSLLDYRLAWSRTLLRGLGAIENPRPAFWTITPRGHALTEEDIRAATDAMLARLSSDQGK